MSTITISTENRETFSSISNHFIDYYMTEANGDFVKIYLYLVRLYSAGNSISVSAIADHFNCTEKDVCRAIRYWISVDVLKFRYNKAGEITGIVLLNLAPPAKAASPNVVSFTAALSDISTTASQQQDETSALAQGTLSTESTEEVEEAAVPALKAPAKRRHTVKTITAKQKDETFADIIMQAEAYFNKTITQSDIDTLIYIYDTLQLPVDLIEYLLEYCASIGKTKFSYIEAVAINWYEAGIQTREDAKLQSQVYNPLFRSVFKELGITNRSIPTSIELTYIEAWQQEYGFEDGIILEACRRAVLSKPNSANFAYVNGILENWHKNNVKRLSDIERVDEEFRRNQARGKNTGSTSSQPVSSFSNFKQTKMDTELDEMARLFIDEVNES
jgi:DnaD/phage-associated family protein